MPDTATNTPSPSPAMQSAARQWATRVQEAKEYWAADFRRMKEDMEFAAGLQWEDEPTLSTEKYVANLTLRVLNDKTASLYARDPQATVRMRPRLMYQLWDGTQQMLETAVAAVSGPAGTPEHLHGVAVLTDYNTGREYEKLCERIGKTAETLYNLMVDLQETPFKLQMKQLIRRVLTCGVGYVRLQYDDATTTQPSSSLHFNSLVERLQKAADIALRLERGELQQDSAEAITLQSLVASLNSMPASTPLNGRLLFDFPDALSVIVDNRCRCLKGFIGAQWVAQEFVMTSDEVNSLYGLTAEADRVANADRVTVWEIFDNVTRTTCTVTPDKEDFLVAPEPLPYQLTTFWPIVALTFNDIEVVDGLRVKCYPVSDVHLLKHPQRDWNQRRNSLRGHRKASSPLMAYSENALTPEDRKKLEALDPNQINVVGLRGLSPEQNVNNLLQRVAIPSPDYAQYTTDAMQQDILQTVGLQAADLGQQTSGETATGQTLAAQSKMNTASSNVFDLDLLLSSVAQLGGEILFAMMSPTEVKELVGPGAVWPSNNNREFSSAIYLTTRAASSGRPNKALEVSNFERLAPLLLQAGANPKGLIEEGIRRLDENLALDKFFPVMPLNMGAPQVGVDQRPAVPEAKAGPSQPPMPVAGTALPLAGTQP